MARVIEHCRRWLRAQAEEEEDDAGALAPSLPLREIFRRFWPDARPYRRWLPLLLLFVAIGPALQTAEIWLYKLLVDNVLVPHDFDRFLPIALAYLGLTLLGGLVTFGDDYLSDWVGERFLLDLRTRVFGHLQNLPLDALAARRRGDLVARLTSDVDEIETLFISGITDAVSYLLRIVFFVGALLYLSWQLTLVSLVVAPAFWLASRLFSGRIKRVAREQRRRGGAIGAVVEESLAMAPLVQAYNRQETEIDRLRREALGSFSAQMRLTRLRAAFAPLLELFQLGAVLVVVGAGTWALSQGSLTLGGLLVFITYLTQLLEPIRGLSQLVPAVFAASAGAERIIELLDLPLTVQERPDALQIGRSPGAIRVDGVSFHYPTARRQTLTDLTFGVEAGQTLAIVGPSGAGKSTVVRLLLRFLDPTSGRLTIDGHDLRDIDLRSLRDNIAVVWQEPLLFGGTIRENIAYGRPGATEGEIVRAAQAADAHAFITALPAGYDTLVGQDGARLSGGQRQRIAIARAMIRDAPILILDEPTTGLDADSSERILAPLRRLMAGRATILISHDLQTVRDATEIVVLDRGHIVERGTHDALIAASGAYARLYRLREPDFRETANGRELAGVA